MESATIMRNGRAIEIVINDDDEPVMWTELMLMFIDALKGMGYHSNRFEELQDECDDL